MVFSPIDVRVREVGLRDGLQMIAAQVPTEVKIDWLLSLIHI